MEEIKQIRVKTTSKIYNLAFENIFKDQLEERNKADNTRRSYKNWIDTVLCRSEHELLNNRPEDESKELEEFLSDLASKLPDCVETIESNSAGEILFHDDSQGRTDVTYDESGLLGMNCKTVLTFDRKSPAELLCTEPESPVLHSFSTAKRRESCARMKQKQVLWVSES